MGLCLVLALAALTSLTAQTTEGPTQGSDRPQRAVAAGPSGETAAQPDPNPKTTATEDAAMQRRFNELESDLLEEREKSIDRWLVVIGLVLTFFGIVVAIAGLWAFGRFRNIEEEARSSAAAARGHAETAGQLVGEIAKHKTQSERDLELIQQVTAEVAHDEPREASRAAEAVKEDPEASPIDKTIGCAIALQASGKTDEAIKLWRCIARIAEAGQEDKLNARATYSIAFLLMKSDPEGAIAGYNKAIELDPENLKAYGNRGISKAALGRHEEAVADYDKVIELDPSDVKGYHNRGMSKAAPGRHEEAIADYDKAIELDPSLGPSYLSRGISKAALSRHRDAISDYNKAIELDPENLKAYGNRGISKAALGRHEEAIVDYDKVIELNPSDAKGYHNRGVSSAALSRHRDAIADYDKAIELDPSLGACYLSRGNAKAALGLAKEAKLDFEAARRAGEHT